MFIAFFVALAIAWGLTPGMMVFVAFVFESRWLPLFDRRRQFRAFFPGDLFLGVAVALIAEVAWHGDWRMSAWTVVIIFVATCVTAIGITLLEARDATRKRSAGKPAYSRAAMYGPTKLCHNLLLYGGYGGAAVIVALTALLGFQEMFWAHVVIAAIYLTGWIIFLREDAMTNHDSERFLDGNAHAPWRPIWTQEGRQALFGSRQAE